MKIKKTWWNAKLQRQIATHLKSFGEITVQQEEQLEAFFQVVSGSYDEFERNQVQIERSMELSSKELYEANRDLRIGNEEIQSLYRILSAVQETNSTEEVCAAVLPEIQSFSQFPMVVIELYGAHNMDLRMVAQVGIPAEFVEESAQKVWPKITTRTCLSVPIDSPTGIIGLLTLADVETRPRNERFSHWLNVVATQIGVVMERKRLDEIMQLQQAKMISAAKMSELGKMAGSIAHEINTPLATISLLTEQLQDVLRSPAVELETAAHCADIIGLTTNRIAKIISGLRTFSRDGNSDAMEPAKLSQIVTDTISLCHEHIKKNSIHLTVNVAAHIEVCCRPIQISQVILNLINNSQDAVEQQKEKWIKIDGREEIDEILLIVTDSGRGISPDIRDKLFDPFFTTKGIGKGTGLGLSISTAIMKSHDGTIEYDATVANTCFIVRMPKSKKLPLKHAA